MLRKSLGKFAVELQDQSHEILAYFASCVGGAGGALV
jgi:hypothetical protein